MFAHGGGGLASDSAETGYWAIRAALSVTMREAASHVATEGLTQRGAPPLVRLIAGISSRFVAVITTEAAALAVPVAGAVSGGAANYLFIDHFQNLARAHFIIKRLESE